VFHDAAITFMSWHRRMYRRVRRRSGQVRSALRKPIGVIPQPT
jgi:hypothetical protein